MIGNVPQFPLSGIPFPNMPMPTVSGNETFSLPPLPVLQHVPSPLTFELGSSLEDIQKEASEIRNRHFARVKAEADVVVFSQALCNQNAQKYGQPQAILRDSSGNTEFSLNSGFDSGSSDMSCLDADQDAPEFVKPTVLVKALTQEAPSPEPQIDPELVAKYFQQYPHYQHQKKDVLVSPVVVLDDNREESGSSASVSVDGVHDGVAGQKATSAPSVAEKASEDQQEDDEVPPEKSEDVLSALDKPEGYPCHCKYCKSFADTESVVEVPSYVPPPVKRKGNAFFLDSHKLHAGGKLTEEALLDLHNEKLLQTPEPQSKFHSLVSGPLDPAPVPEEPEEEQLTAANLKQHDQNQGPGISAVPSQPSDAKTIVSVVSIATGVTEKKVWGLQNFTTDHFDDAKMKRLQASEAYLKAWESSKTIYSECELVKEEENEDGWHDLEKPELVADGVPSFRFTKEEIKQRFARKRPCDKDLKFYAKKAALAGLWGMFEENELTCVERVGVGIREVWSNAQQDYVYQSNTVAYLTFDGSRRQRCMREISALLDEGVTHGVCKINFRWNDRVRKKLEFC